jgi:hypothetical protein
MTEHEMGKNCGIWDVPPLGQMTHDDLEQCPERASWLVERERLLPRGLWLK